MDWFTKHVTESHYQVCGGEYADEGEPDAVIDVVADNAKELAGIILAALKEPRNG